MTPLRPVGHLSFQERQKPSSHRKAGIRKRTLIITLPGSRKASQENILAVIDPVAHGLDMLYSEGSADCAK